MADDVIYGLSEGDIDRLRDLLGAYERGQLRPALVTTRKPSVLSPIESYLTMTASTIPAYTGGVAGSGPVYALSPDDTSILRLNDIGLVGHNIYQIPLGVGTKCFAIRDPLSGQLFLIPIISSSTCSDCEQIVTNLTLVDNGSGSGQDLYATVKYMHLTQAGICVNDVPCGSGSGSGLPAPDCTNECASAWTHCCTQLLPTTLSLVVTSAGCSEFNGTFPMTYTNGTFIASSPLGCNGHWTATISPLIDLIMYCTDTGWEIVTSYRSNAWGYSAATTGWTCDPLSVHGTCHMGYISAYPFDHGACDITYSITGHSCSAGSGSGSGPIKLTCCGHADVPSHLCITIFGSSCPCLNGSYTLDLDTASSSYFSAANPFGFHITCNSMDCRFRITVGCNGSTDPGRFFLSFSLITPDFYNHDFGQAFDSGCNNISHSGSIDNTRGGGDPASTWCCGTGTTPHVSFSYVLVSGVC